METTSISSRAESEVVWGNQSKKLGEIEMAINKYKCAIYLFIYSFEDTNKEMQKAYYQLRIKQILILLNETEVENNMKPTTIDELQQYASTSSNKSQILSHSESSNIRSTINYPLLTDSCPPLCSYGSFHENQGLQYPEFQNDAPIVQPYFISSIDQIQRPSGSMPFINTNPFDYPTIPVPSSLNGDHMMPQPHSENQNNLSEPSSQLHSSLPSSNLPPNHKTPSSSHPKTTPPLYEFLIDLNKFEKIKTLGFGSFGKVFLAKEKLTGKLFAIKELNSIERFEDQKYFLREVEALTQAVYPAVLHLRGFSQYPTPSIVTEYLSGGSLQDVINGKKLMNKTQRVKALYGVASAMRYLHNSLSIVHRDLKPANVMLNEDLEPVVGDFGLAKIMTKMMMKQTQKAGSPVYMAPELMSGKEYTNKVDVYSFGILCYELLSELLAFDKCTSIVDLMNKVIGGSRPDLRNTKISNSFRELIQKCWQNDAEKRPSFKEIVSELRKDQYLEDIDKNAFMEYLTRLRKSR